MDVCRATAPCTLCRILRSFTNSGMSLSAFPRMYGSKVVGLSSDAGRLPFFSFYDPFSNYPPWERERNGQPRPIL